tara:strand:- start:16131 stop:16472 length:342 start_codon:yes stop_codon:yes gene_type:complete
MIVKIYTKIILKLASWNKSFYHKTIETLQLIKVGLATEKDETRVMLRTYIQYSKGKASREEMKIANAQFRDFLRTIGLGALAFLPFAPLTIPFIVKLGRKFKVEILPSSFREK